MTLYKNKYRIESTRLKGWNYSSPGYYFVTICVNKRECLLGQIINGEMVPNEFGRVVLDCWNDLMNHYTEIKLDEFIIMPNHIHGILVILSADKNCGDIVETGLRPVLKDGKSVISVYSNNIGEGHDQIKTGQRPVSTKTKNTESKANQKPHGLSEIVGALKSYSARHINKIRNTAGMSVWQSSFYDHNIRDEDDLLMIREYIQNNPVKWEEDEEYVP